MKKTIKQLVKWLKKDMDKGGHNTWPSKIKIRPAPPSPLEGANK